MTSSIFIWLSSPCRVARHVSWCIPPVCNTTWQRCWPVPLPPCECWICQLSGCICGRSWAEILLGLHSSWLKSSSGAFGRACKVADEHVVNRPICRSDFKIFGVFSTWASWMSHILSPCFVMKHGLTDFLGACLCAISSCSQVLRVSFTKFKIKGGFRIFGLGMYFLSQGWLWDRNQSFSHFSLQSLDMFAGGPPRTAASHGWWMKPRPPTLQPAGAWAKAQGNTDRGCDGRLSRNVPRKKSWRFPKMRVPTNHPS